MPISKNHSALISISCHSNESGNPVFSMVLWIPVFTRMTFNALLNVENGIIYVFWNSLIADLMKQKFQKTSVYLVFVSLFFITPTVLLIGCGDVEPVTTPPPPEVAEISNILKNRWKLGYETESLDLYISSFWKEGFFYWSDMATPMRINLRDFNPRGVSYL